MIEVVLHMPMAVDDFVAVTTKLCELDPNAMLATSDDPTVIIVAIDLDRPTEPRTAGRQVTLADPLDDA